MKRLFQVLLVEDNPGDVDLTRESLEGSEDRIVLTVITKGEEAIEFLQRRGPHAAAVRPDLVLLDLNLPGIEGKTILAKVKQDAELKRVPVCVLTSSSAETDITQSYDLGANCYVIKPLDFKTFVNILRLIEEFWFSIVKLPQQNPT